MSNHPILPPTRLDIPPEIRVYVITILNQTLACTLDLRSHVKHAGWNVQGTDAAQLQTLFALLAVELEAYTDLGLQEQVRLNVREGDCFG